ncbi:aminotransferase class I/II-fold pyridoxal phosphate-dependent enzyme [Amycolatopsis sp. GM8]|uniref:aminotransferase class I/II-fold pyridoxal phosphate-dependent enzyme n=1 Tax=Amycolatopsis sp. GM8 TaxID=2896530 RepID=UPI001F0013D4|nr:aminotransferase class I/II-fold pyridoxal phosphate-dependent enzyme [Amycolatopsis sp. GM8]
MNEGGKVLTAHKRRRIDNRRNLSSNELLHQDMDTLLEEALAGLGPTLIRRYPVTAEAIDDIAGHVGLNPQEFMLTPGSDCAIRLLAWRQVRHGTGGLLLQWPNYDAWEDVAARSGLAVERIAGEPDQANRSLCEAAARTSGQLVVLSTPNGPAGWTTPEPVLDDLVRIAAERDHLLVIDSCYQAFTGPWTHHLARRGANVVVVQTLSKSHGLAGARLALLAGEPELVAELARERTEQTVSAIAVQMARALMAREAELGRIWSDIGKAREHAVATLSSLGHQPLPSGGNFLTIPVGTPLAATTLQEQFSRRGYRIRLLTEAEGLSGHIRFTVGDPDLTTDVLAEFTSLLGYGS